MVSPQTHLNIHLVGQAAQADQDIQNIAVISVAEVNLALAVCLENQHLNVGLNAYLNVQGNNGRMIGSIASLIGNRTLSRIESPKTRGLTDNKDAPQNYAQIRTGRYAAPQKKLRLNPFHLKEIQKDPLRSRAKIDLLALNQQVDGHRLQQRIDQDHLPRDQPQNHLERSPLAKSPLQENQRAKHHQAKGDHSHHKVENARGHNHSA